MKRLKFLPSVLMLVLCVAVLCFGIYAAAPATSTVTGTIKVDAAKAYVEISLYTSKDGFKDPIYTSSSRNGFEYDIGDVLDFTNLDEAVSADEVFPNILKIHIKNKSDKALGAYFYSGNGLDADNFATADSILLSQTAVDKGEDLESTEDDTVVANLDLSPYSYIAKNNDMETVANQNDYDEIDMYIKASLAGFFDETMYGEFELKLNIEEYVANVTSLGDYWGIWDESTWEDEYGEAVSGNAAYPLTKISDTRNILYVNGAFYRNTTIEHVVIPSNQTAIGPAAFYGCTNLKGVFMADSISQFTYDNDYGVQETFYDTSLQSVVLSNRYYESTSGDYHSGFALYGSLGSISLLTCCDYGAGYEIILGHLIINENMGSEISTKWTPYALEVQHDDYDYGYSFHPEDLSECILSAYIPEMEITDVSDGAAKAINNGYHNVFGNVYGNGIYVGDESNPYKKLVSFVTTKVSSFNIHDDTIRFAYGVFDSIENLQYNTYSYAKYIGSESNPYRVLIKSTNTSITSCTINENTRIIFPRAFSGVPGFQITIPASVVYIGADAFDNTSWVITVKAGSDTLETYYLPLDEDYNGYPGGPGWYIMDEYTVPGEVYEDSTITDCIYDRDEDTTYFWDEG